MSLSIHDLDTNELLLSVNSWHWRAIVKAIRLLAVIPDTRVDSLNEVCVGELTQEEARSVAQAMKSVLLPSVKPQERLLLNGQNAKVDDGTFHRARDEQWKNYGTDLETLTKFAQICEASSGISVQP